MPFATATRILLCTALLLSAATAAGDDAGTLRVEGLRCEYFETPLAVESAAPRLSWILASEQRGARQSGYRVLVASSAELLAADTGDLWDSGRVGSAESVHVAYGGSALASRQVCHWKVRAWDGDGVPGPWSAPARWEMGLLADDDWSAAWIGAEPRPVEVTIERAVYQAEDRSVHKDVTPAVAAMVAAGAPVSAANDALGGDPAPNVRKRLVVDYRCAGHALRATLREGENVLLPHARLPYLRKSFSLEKPVRRARLYATALGLYDLWLGGERVGGQHLAPGWTDYRERVLYQAYDVTERLAAGANVLGARVGPGWFSGRAGLFRIRDFYGETPALRAQLEITYTDGTTERIVTDASWRRHDGPLLAADLMDGAVCDAAAAIDDWCAPGLDESGWQPVAVREEQRHLEATCDHPVRVLAELPAIARSAPQPGRWTFDLGQNMVGVVRLRVEAPAGTVVTIRHAEMLNSDGTIYTANLRAAHATDTYICRGGGVEEWQPPFTTHGFRYVELTGLEREPPLDAVTGVVLGSDMPVTGTFACSDERLNQLQSNISWGLQGNYVSIPTDCPQRDERMGWLGDAQAFAPTAAYNREIAAFMTKWMRDVRDAQRADGAHSDVAPATRGLNYGTPAWADAGVIVPWTVYRYYGDRRILEENIDSMVAWVEWCRTHSTDLIRDRERGNDYGDWLSIEADTPKELIGTAYFAHAADIVAGALRALGRTAEADEYAQLFERIRRAFCERYVEADGRIAGGTQTAHVLALQFGLLPEAQRAAALQRLVADVRAKGDRISTGFVGVSHILPVLSDNGAPEMAWRLLMQDAFPSWLYSVRHGATTIWERWNGWTPQTGPHPDDSMNSFNHYALGSCGQWLFAGVAGIRPAADTAGFAEFVVAPQVGGPLNWARGSFRSMQGEIVSDWRKDGAALSLEVTVPANTRATVHVPARAGATVRVDGQPLEQVAGVEVVERGEGAVVVRVGGGRYAFTSELATARAGNPVVPGWYADPEVARFDGRYWIYPTSSAPYDEQLHFDAFSSPDLLQWTKHPRVLTSESVSWARRAMWAPSVVENGGRYFFFFGANDIQNDEQHGGIGVAVADRPEGPFEDYLGAPLIDAFHNGAQPIDQFAFRDGDGRWYLIYGGWRHCNIARLRDDFRGFEPFEDGTTFREITPAGYVEGPCMFIRDGRYYFMWSEGGWTGPDYSVAYAIADSPLGPFERVGKILEQDPAVATGAGHHSVLQIEERDEYYIVYHRRPLGETDGNHRVTCIDRMTFDRDGRIAPVKITFEGVEGRP